MSDITVTSTEARRLREQEGDIVKKSKDFLTSSLRWSFALLGVKDLLINMQVTFIAISIALITLFGISSRTTRSDRGVTFVNFVFLLLGCLVVGIAINSILLNSYTKWVIYGMFLATVATNPDYQQNFEALRQISKSICEATSLRLRNLFIQSRVIIENLFKINVADQEEPSMNNNPSIRSVDSDEGRVGEDIV